MLHAHTQARTAGNLQSSKHLLALIDCLGDENGNHKLDDNLEPDLATSATIMQKDSNDNTPQCLSQQPSGSSSFAQLVEPVNPQCLQQ